MKMAGICQQLLNFIGFTRLGLKWILRWKLVVAQNLTALMLLAHNCKVAQLVDIIFIFTQVILIIAWLGITVARTMLEYPAQSVSFNQGDAQ